MSPVLSLSHVSFALPTGRAVLGDLTFSLSPGRHGLVGDNGSGKSTLLRLLAGDLEPTSGVIDRRGTLARLPQSRDAGPTVADLLGVAEPLAAMRRIEAGSVDPTDFELVGDDWDLTDQIDRRLDALGLGGLDPDRTGSELSGGESTLVRLAGLLARDPEVLLLDEPTNDLDAAARARLRDVLAQFGGVLVVVSHDRELLETMDDIGELRDGQVSWFGGDFSHYEQAVAAQQQTAERAVATARADVRRQQRDLIEQQTKQARRDRQGRAQAKTLPPIVAGAYQRRAQESAGRLRGMHEDRLETARAALTEARDQVRDDRRIRVDLPATAVPAQRDVLRAEALVAARGRAAPLDLVLRGPERVALVGRNGVGKTSTLRAILGLQAPRSGQTEVLVPWRYLPQGVDLLDSDQSVFESVRAVAPAADPHAIRAQLARFLFRGTAADQLVGTLSGGERWRATLGSLLLAEPAPQLLVLDEPTNSLDLASVAHLTEALAAYRGALLVVSHDARFLADLDLDRRLDLSAGE